MTLDCHIVVMDWPDYSRGLAYEISRFGPDWIDCPCSGCRDGIRLAGALIEASLGAAEIMFGVDDDRTVSSGSALR